MAAAVTSAAPLALSWPGGPAGTEPVAAAPGPRGVAAGRFALELGRSIDLLNFYSGGFPYGNVLEFREGGEPSISNKLISNVSFEEITIQVGADMSPALREWVADMVGGHQTDPDALPRSGAILMADFNYQVHHRLEFHDAWISEVTFPKADAASKEQAFLTIVISPESTEYKPGSGTIAPPATKQKLWQSSNFRLTIPSLPTQKVVKVEAVTIKQQITEFRDGADPRFPRKLLGNLEYPNLVPTLSSADGQPWFDYFEEYVLDGLNVPEKAGQLEWLTPDLQSVLIGVDVSGMGIVKCALEKLDGASDNVARITAELYTEHMSLLPAVQ